MAELCPFGEPENESERKAFEYLRDNLPDSYKLFTNLEIKQGVEIYEVDLIIIAPHCVYVVDIKNWHGNIEIYDPNWYPDNYQPFLSPLKKLRKHAKVLSSMICDTNRVRESELRKVHIQAAVLMTNVDVKIIDRGDKDGEHITYLDERCIKYFKNKAYIPEYRHQDIKHHITTVERAIKGKSSPKTAPPRYRDWQVEDKLSSNDRYTEYRAKNLMMGMSSWTARLRVYKVDPLLETTKRQEQYKLISTAFRAVRQLPFHPNILSVQDFFESREHDCLVMVTEDVPGQVLHQHIKKQNLGWEQKLAIIRDVLDGLEHAHKHGVIHRNITPDSILITATGQARLVGFDYARVSDRTSTIADDIIDDLEKYAAYQAIECQNDPSQASVASDLFSVGLVFYELLTGVPAFEDANQIYECNAAFPIQPSERNLELSWDWDRWLQKLCAFDPKDRYPNADVALQELIPLATLPNLDITNLLPDTIIDNQYQVIKRLGRPGSFAVAYHVFDTLRKGDLVLKLVTRDRRSVYERLQQEYSALLKVPKHPHIVEVIFASRLKDDTPFIVFEYVDGQDIESLIDKKTLSLEESVEIAKQTAAGLLHLHQHKVRHQDIKPSNLLLTDKGVRIIDFNVAVSDSDEMTISAGTRRYIPPDCKRTINLTPEEKIDRDLYALGIVFYECVTGRYPFDEPQPPKRKLPHNPIEIDGCEDLSDELVQLLMRAIAPKRANRFTSAVEFLKAIDDLSCLRKSTEQPQRLNIEKAILPDEDEVEKQLQEVVHAVVSPTVIEVIETSKISENAEYSVKRYTSGTLAGTQSINAKTTPAHFHLFDPPKLTSQSQINPDKPIVLDPTGKYEIPSDYIPITTEVEWMESFGINASPYWVKGKRLCEWADEWLKAWGKLDAIAQIKQDPCLRLQEIFGSLPLPSEWTENQQLAVATRLDSYPRDNPVAHLLADITETDKQIWLGEPSIGNLAAWLAVQVPQDCKPLEQLWQSHYQEHDLAIYYQTQDKLMLLRRWLLIAEPAINELPKYPLPIPNCLVEEFDGYWEQQLYRTEAKILENLIPSEQVGFERIASVAYNVLDNRPNWLNKVREKKITAYLSHQQRETISDKQPPAIPDPLHIEASPKEALTWVTENYLPFRRWEMVVHQPPSEQKVSDRLANSFVEWMLQHYPQIKGNTVEYSELNYSVASLVQNLCQSTPVLWVVVDGLGWLDHIELLSFLTQNKQLAIESYVQPRFSILPTKTEYAKWSLYAQLLPSDSSWVDDAGQAFSKMGIGERYTDSRTAKLRQDLKQGKHRLYCWDTEQFDKLHHTERDWQHLYKVKRPHTLEGIAREIQSFVGEYSHPDEIQIIIASDHGQILGTSERITHCPENLEPKGRIAIGKTDDPRFVVLSGDRYGLPHDISVIKGSASLGSFSYTTNRKILGSHGGLFPEEVVVGVSVLRKSVQRRPVLVFSRGEGKPGQIGKLEIAIDNPNSVPLMDVCLQINELSALKSGKPLQEIIPANDKLTLTLDIPEVPELSPNHEGDSLSLTGELSFRFPSAEIASANLSSDSTFRVEQIFTSGIAGFNVDEF
ncbi:MAG: protein kinase [Goleter apudmare HA4340-LM2]|jgi:serine/threonine protein kinase|nr:protein kinase [Goleter apudmare HA4340-LM2]